MQTGETPPNGSTESLEESLIPEDELQSHLLDLYFEWEQPWLQVVNEKLFRESMRCGGRYFSPLLLNCILAVGSRYCDRIEVRSDPNDSNTAGKIFLDRAERLIQHDLRWPKITTIQSLAIMGMAYIVSVISQTFTQPIKLISDRQWGLMLLAGFTKVWPIAWP